MAEPQVPAHPVVDIKVSADSVTVDGAVVDRGSTGGPDTKVAMHLGVHAAARRVAQPLGRPVRAVLTVGAEVKHLVVHPDGSVSDVEDTFPVVSLIAPPGSRATPISWSARRPRRRPSVDGARLAMGAAYVGLAVVLVSGFVVSLSDDDPAAVAEGALEAPGHRNSPHDVVVGQQLQRLPGVSDVVADAGEGGFRLQVTTGRAAHLKVLASLVGGNGETRVWNIETTGADTRTLAVDGLEAGSYRWVVRTSGEAPRTGNVLVRPTPPPVVDASDTPDSPPSSPPTSSGGDQDSGGDDHDGPGSEMPGPTAPVDPDDPTTP